ncbi:hypothetical protein C0992_001176 [Termitomyces sp. T32_za158]|nr:hypothetical protein C0992_001176 [Termitomyces sp. T32_za158]
MNHAPSHLPPVSEVFKKVADAESYQSFKPAQGRISPIVAPQVLGIPSSPTFPAVLKVDAALAPTSAVVQPSSLASSPVPALAITSRTAASEAHVHKPSAIVTGYLAPTGSTYLPESLRAHPTDTIDMANRKASSTISSVGPTKTGTVLDAAKPPSTDVNPHGTASRLLMICAVMASLIALMFLVYFILNYRLFAFCRRRKEEEEEADSWTKIASPPPPGTYLGPEKEIVYQPTLSQRSASSIYSNHSSEGPVSASNTRLDCTVLDEIIDINSNYPRSKFSLCSSEYPPSIRSQSSTSSVLAPLPLEHNEATTLAPAYEIYYQPHHPSEDNRHSRTHSEPIVRSDATEGASQLLIRAIQHRRSRSISGLTYTVKEEQRESGSSGDWTGSPQSPSGWPCAL